MNTPTTQQISDQIVSQLEALLQQTFLPKSFSRVLAKAQSGAFLLVYKYAGFSLLQMFVAHATDKPTLVNGKVIRPLREWARLIGAGEPYAATRAELVITVTVQNQTGDLAAGAQLVRSDTGVIYEVIAERALNAPTVLVTIRAISDQARGGGVGSIGNLQIGDVLEFANTQPNVATKAVVAAIAASGADAESTSAYRARIIRRFQRKPQGGAPADYQAWAEEVPGVLNAYPYRSSNPGFVTVYVEATRESSGSADGIPTTAQRDAVAASIEAEQNGLASRRPVNAFTDVQPISRRAFNITILGLEPSTSDMRAALSQGIQEYLLSREPFIVGLSVLPRLDRITLAALSGIAESIVGDNGGSLVSLSVTPGPSYTLGPGEKAKLGALGFL
jgi:uncharacterized phage protein gp47/JayE